MENEIWRDVKGYEGLYQVSNLGRVKSYYAKNGRLTTKTRIIIGAKDKDGYFKITLTKNKLPKYYRIHCLVAETFIPNNKNKLQVNHKDGNKTNNIVDNLEWCTSKENNTHAHTTGLHKGCRTNVIIDGKFFPSINDACKYLKIDRCTLRRKKIKSQSNEFKYHGKHIKLTGGKSGGKLTC